MSPSSGSGSPGITEVVGMIGCTGAGMGTGASILLAGGVDTVSGSGAGSGGGGAGGLGRVFVVTERPLKRFRLCASI